MFAHFVRSFQYLNGIEDDRRFKGYLRSSCEF